MPAYIVISEANGLMPVIGRPVRGQPPPRIKRQRSDPTELAAAVGAIAARIAAAQRPVATITSLTKHYGVADKAVKTRRQGQHPGRPHPQRQGVLDESLAQYIGLYAGAGSHPAAVRDIVENADLILDIGGVMPSNSTPACGAVS